MPEMGGHELVERLRARQPNLRVLFMSGYTERTLTRNGSMPSGTGFVEKPFPFTPSYERANVYMVISL